MGIDASKPSPSSRKFELITASKPVPGSDDAERSQVFNEKETLWEDPLTLSLLSPTLLLADHFNARNDKTKTIVRVGTGIGQRVFHVERAVLYNSSASVRSHSYSSNPSHVTDVDLPDGDPIAAEMFVEWAKRPKSPIIYAPGQYSDEPWTSNAAAAWLLGHRLDAAMFQEYALSQFIQNCAVALRGPWKLIEDCAPAESPLRRFSIHWVAWDSSLSGPYSNEYANLDAAKHASQVRSSTRDPRILDLDHWYSDCGNDINAQCDHDPIFQANQREKDRLRKRTSPPVWGAEYELANTSTISSPTHIKHEVLSVPPQSRRSRRQGTKTLKPVDNRLSRSKAPLKQANLPLSPVEEWLRSTDVPKSASSSKASRTHAISTLSPVEDWLRDNEI
ncbi:MAG: hypothetical protein Q9170_003897 [Blastenia crenularia]